MYIEDECLENYYELVPAVINKILNMFEYPEQNTEGKYQYAIDFLDMIFLPVYYNMSIPYSLRGSLDTILIDESQDLSQLQQMFVRRLYTGLNRFIFVGDRNQSIYGFNGADTKAIDRIKSNFEPKELPLSICYRCPEKVVRLSQQIVPDIEWNKNREDKGNIAAITYSEMKKFNINNINKTHVDPAQIANTARTPLILFTVFIIIIWKGQATQAYGNEKHKEDKNIRLPQMAPKI